MITDEQLRNLHKLVWDFRAAVAEHWPTPTPADSLRYAFTEAGEAMDALLREKRPNDKRNRDKDHDRLDEWADCSIMLFTALPGYNNLQWKADAADGWEMAAAAASWKISDEQLALRIVNHLFDKGSIPVTVSLIANLPGMELQARVVERLRRIMHKHVPPYRWSVVEAVFRPYVAFDHTKV